MTTEPGKGMNRSCMVF